MRRKVFYLLFILIGKTVLLYRDNCRKDALFKIGKRNSRLDTVLISSIKSERLAFCAKSCLEEESCKSFNYNLLTRFCELLSKDTDEIGLGLLKNNLDWNYYLPVKSLYSPRCRSTTGSEFCAWTQACKEVCENPVGYKCHNLENIAFRKTTLQSSTCAYGYSPRAVDGNAATNWAHGSCTHTCGGTPNWWRVDFGDNAVVYSLQITNRGDCCGARLSNFNIRIGDSTEGSGDKNTPCAQNQGISQGASKIFLCRPKLQGRYLYIQSNIVDGLTLCEVKAMGEFL